MRGTASFIGHDLIGRNLDIFLYMACVKRYRKCPIDYQYTVYLLEYRDLSGVIYYNVNENILCSVRGYSSYFCAVTFSMALGPLFLDSDVLVEGFAEPLKCFVTAFFANFKMLFIFFAADAMNPFFGCTASRFIGSPLSPIWFLSVSFSGSTSLRTCFLSGAFLVVEKEVFGLGPIVT